MLKFPMNARLPQEVHRLAIRLDKGGIARDTRSVTSVYYDRISTVATSAHLIPCHVALPGLYADRPRKIQNHKSSHLSIPGSSIPPGLFPHVNPPAKPRSQFGATQLGKRGYSSARAHHPIIRYSNNGLRPFRCQKNQRKNAGLAEHSLSSALSSPTLSQEQDNILRKVLEGESIFFTGSAGTGKSVLLRAIINALEGPSATVAVTASTGISAVNIGGQTLHSFAGAGLGNAPLDTLVLRVRRQRDSVMRWLNARVLIIDEISMVAAPWFDALEGIAREIRRNTKPFGGIQLVVCGDFFQLPPVPDREARDTPASFAFDASAWDQCIKTNATLTKVFRQKDPKLVNILNDARVGIISKGSVKLLRSLARPINYSDGIGPTELYPTRVQAERANQTRMNALPGKTFSYNATDRRGKDQDGNLVQPGRAEQLLGQFMALKSLDLKVGTQVMCLRDVKHTQIVNGSTGRVVEFMRPEQFRPELKLYPNSLIVSSLESKPESDEESAPPKRQRALRGRRLDYETTKWPVVEFSNGMRALMGPISFKAENRSNIMEVERIQVPLIPAWALTIHKSQGQTLERVKIDLRRMFECGQAYVALSRCTSFEGLEVYNFSESRVTAHPRVQEWSRQLTTLDS